MKLLVQVRMFSAEIAMVDTFAAKLSQQSSGAAFSRAEALRIAAMEWLKERQARRASVTASLPQRESEAEAEAEPERAVTEEGAVISTPSPPVEPPSRQAQILTTIHLTERNPEPVAAPAETPVTKPRRRAKAEEQA